MKALCDRISWIASLTGESDFSTECFRVITPGSEAFEIDDFIFVVEPQGLTAPHIGATFPESLSVLRLADPPGHVQNAHDRARLSNDLACVLSLALDRRVFIPCDIQLNTGPGQTTFSSVTQVIDQSIQGPLPPNTRSNIMSWLTAVAGLPSEHQEAIGSAASAYYGALLLFDREPRSAYTLLVAGLESLSRKYGSPPGDWTAWEQAISWDGELLRLGLSEGQAQAIRARLLRDKQLRLNQTFREYASSRIDDTFWNRTIEQWVTGLDISTNDWLPPKCIQQRKVSELLSPDKKLLSRCLGETYRLRSSIVHEVHWVDLLKLSQPFATNLGDSRPLSFSILRVLLAELIEIEITSHTTDKGLPDFRLFRNDKFA